ncbi:hypothetical protein ACF8MH_02915 [Pseudomonas sp. YQ_13]|uniref:hypothetical protein n=1 Tax=Pseudomonas sp. YQ_13 TaxID=3367235 RepID=UPI00370BD1C8
MSAIKRNLQKLVDRVKLNRRFCADEHHHALADGVQDLLAEIEQLREANEQVCTNYNRVSFTSEERGKQIDQLKAENERFRRYCEVLEGDKKALTETHVLYTWLRKKCDEPSNDVVAVRMNIGHDWAKVTDLDRDLRAMIDREEP